MLVTYENYKDIFISEDDFSEIKNKVFLTPKSSDYLIVTDFDDTIFSREEQLKESELFNKYKDLSSTQIVLDHYWIDNFINIYFKNKEFPKDILWKLRKWTDLILTAWNKDLQTAKLNILWLIDYNYIIVDKPIDKIKELITYITDDYKQIPSKIIIFEDKVEYFVKYKELLEVLLNVQIDIFEVKMDWNTWYKSIKKK